MASLFTKTLNSEEFKAIVNESSQTTDAIIDNIEISNFEFPVKSIKNIYFTNSEWNHITLTDQHYLENVVFENCVINNSDFTGVNLTNVRFVKCRIHNVIFNKSRFDKITFDNSEIDSTDTNIERSYREMIGDEVHFNNSKITGINFFHSTMKTYFNNSELYDIKALGLKEGSLLSIIDSKAKLIDFSRSTFDTLTVKNSTIKESKANNCRIGSVVLEDSDLKFPIADGKGYDSVIARNTKNVIIGGTPVKEVSITDCGKSDDIDVAGITFDKIIISDCDPLNFTFMTRKANSCQSQTWKLLSLHWKTSISIT